MYRNHYNDYYKEARDHDEFMLQQLKDAQDKGFKYYTVTFQNEFTFYPDAAEGRTLIAEGLKRCWA